MVRMHPSLSPFLPPHHCNLITTGYLATLIKIFKIAFVSVYELIILILLDIKDQNRALEII